MKQKKKLIQFGAGNIGRSFIGQIFSGEGYEVIFVDVNERLIYELNQKKSFTVVVKHNSIPDKQLSIKNVRAIHAADIDSIKQEISSADIISTSVGKGILPKIIPAISQGLIERFKNDKAEPINIIIAENMRNGADFFRTEFSKYLPQDFPLSSNVGLVETSIGKMVPIMTKEDIKKDPLWVFAESYNQLILDKKGLRGPLPKSEKIMPVMNITAYVDRKLFIHNLGHAAASYLGFRAYPQKKYLYQIFEDQVISDKIKTCMIQSAEALIKEYPEVFSLPDLLDHIDNLLFRFQNKSLGDTIFRVGRDLSRKLNRDDRLMGALLLCRKHKLKSNMIAEALASGFFFKACDENNNLFEADKKFFRTLERAGINNALKDICHMNPKDKTDMKIIEEISHFYQDIDSEISCIL